MPAIFNMAEIAMFDGDFSPDSEKCVLPNIVSLIPEKNHTLENSPFLVNAKINHGSISWPGNIDIAPEMFYDLSQGINL